MRRNTRAGKRPALLAGMIAGASAANRRAYKTICVWPEGKPWDFRIITVPMEDQEPAWRKEAIRLRAHGTSLRKIGEMVGKSLASVQRATA